MIEEKEEFEEASDPRPPLPPSQRLKAAKALDPYSQGELDMLCGLYAAVNGLRLAAVERKTRLTADQCQTLFRHGATFLNEQAKLSAAVRYGLRVKLWSRLVVELTSKATQLLSIPIVAYRSLAPLPDATFELMLDVTRQAIRDRQPVLVLLKGEYEHFTVICGITATRLNLFDSCHYRFVSISSCSLADDVSTSRHRLHAGSLTVLG